MKGKTRIIESSGNVFEDLLLDNPQELTVKARMVLDLARLMRRERLTQKDVAARCKTAQPTISIHVTGALGLPPRVPSMDIQMRSEDISAPFDSAASTNPTGIPTTKAGRATPSRDRASISRRPVGALPMAITAPSIRSARERMAVAARVRPVLADSSATASSPMAQTTSPPNRSTLARLMPRSTI